MLGLDETFFLVLRVASLSSKGCLGLEGCSNGGLIMFVVLDDGKGWAILNGGENEGTTMSSDMASVLANEYKLDALSNDEPS